MNRKAFTLIELLVVIAIIAILAAILFPVFAQAKAAAKKTAALSNAKQTALGAIMYSGDVDDTIPVASTTTPGATSGTLAFAGFRYTPWPALIQPYVKSADLFTDPQAPQSLPTTNGYPADTAKLTVPHFGINPYLVQPVSFPYPTTAAVTPLSPRSFTSISRPADTVFSTAKYSSSESTGNWYGSWWFGMGTYFIAVSIDPPDCAAQQPVPNQLVCAAGWGDNGFYGGTGGTKFLKNVEAAGAWTGGSSLRGTKKIVATFTDGHVSAKDPGALAEGTNYSPAQTNGIPTQKDTDVFINDITKEHWMGVQ